MAALRKNIVLKALEYAKRSLNSYAIYPASTIAAATTHLALKAICNVADGDAFFNHLRRALRYNAKDLRL